MCLNVSLLLNKSQKFLCVSASFCDFTIVSGEPEPSTSLPRGHLVDGLPRASSQGFGPCRFNLVIARPFYNRGSSFFLPGATGLEYRPCECSLQYESPASSD